MRPSVLAMTVAACVVAGGCGRSSSPTPPRAASAAGAPHTPAAPVVVLGPGFSYDAEYRAEGIEDYVTIRLGDRVRIWSRTGRDGWTPATIALLDDADAVVWSARMDLPPTGAITGTLPETTVPWTRVRLTRADGAFDSIGFERRIGVPEQELDGSRMGEIGAVHVAISEPDATESGARITESSWFAAVSSHTSTIDPIFGSVMVQDGTSSYTGIAGGWGDAARPNSDEVWIEKGLRRYLESLTPSRTE